MKYKRLIFIVIIRYLVGLYKNGIVVSCQQCLRKICEIVDRNVMSIKILSERIHGSAFTMVYGSFFSQTLIHFDILNCVIFGLFTSFWSHASLPSIDSVENSSHVSPNICLFGSLLGLLVSLQQNNSKTLNVKRKHDQTL